MRFAAAIRKDAAVGHLESTGGLAAGRLRAAALRAMRRIEAGFDRAFGAAANPWRHLGALSFFFFWIVTASGIYLYVFFDTSVGGAYHSIDQLTHGQRYIGGIMRGLHRYASDTFVVTVVMHLVKELLAGRFAGFRWFSWVSGVPLIWVLLASGIGGYWLVWDELAQFIALGTAEWFDSLPLFSESLVRNFLAPGSVSDRFFTLLIFLHIGLPLALLAGMFIHVQRVNYADVTPGRALGWGTFLALLVLSIARPATSQGSADLALAPQAVALDWFYLAFYPLIYEWSPNTVWALAAGATVALLALPFAARNARARVAQVDLANCNGCGRCFADCPYAAVVMQPRAGGRPGQQHAVVIAGLCASCGICAGACPSSTPFRRNEQLVTGIDMPQLPVNALRAELERALARLGAAPRIIVFGCDCAADARSVAGPGVTAFSLLCAGQLPTSFIEYALRSGAEGVLVTGCREGDCAYRFGNVWTEQRLNRRREPHLRLNVPAERVRVAWFGAGEDAALAHALARFRAALATLPPRIATPPQRLRLPRDGTRG